MLQNEVERGKTCEHIDARSPSCCNGAVRRLLAILLFAAVFLPLILPAFALAQDADAGLPACCRRGGAHGCRMSMGEKAEQLRTPAGKAEKPHWHAPHAACPYCPARSSSLHAGDLYLPTLLSSAALFFIRPTGTAQTESRRRISRDRSRQKRGPPVLSLA